MIRRALKSDVEGDFNAVFLCRCDESAEILERAKLRMNGFVTALLSADGPGASDIVWRRIYGVVFAFAKRPADRMNRRQIEDVEAHCRDIGQPSKTIFQSPMGAGLGGATARKHCVP